MIRKDLEMREHQTLREIATFSDQSKGRLRPEEPCDVRTDFQRDRDRILHSKSFRRLKHKTQVYIAPVGDHFRTRLTHTLEVSQIGRTIARALRLNEDLTEAIALAHDIGHTPFGHSGEKVINGISPYGFRHYEHSLRVVDHLEWHKDQIGLNLTQEVRDGILNHTGEKMASTLEGYIVKLADRIAYINHDIDDALRAGSLSKEDIPKDISAVLGDSCGHRIDTLIKDVISYSVDKDFVDLSPAIKKKMMDLREFMFENVYLDQRSKEQGERIQLLLTALYDYYIKNPKDMGEHMELYSEDEDIHRVVTDYVAGMTDQFAIERFKDLYLPDRIRKV
ncbi:MAG: deoxyguanosinetriphosphate triphosphohydrolase [Tissierellia bacterium]|nr:deoxyguanosinetriphosphate triphosphohydrolase [Tissierellia bacterium]